jgi:peptidyl-prolyl cis-trans isomerase D
MDCAIINVFRNPIWRRYFPMLDIMRRKKRLKFILWLVIFSLAIGMLLFFVPGGNMGGGSTDSSAATVDGREISMKEAANAYAETVRMYKQRFGDKVDVQTLKALGVGGKQVVDSLIAQKVIEIIADRWGLKVTDAELQRVIETMPGLQENGKFVGVEVYKQYLLSSGRNVADFENQIRSDMLTRKVQSVIADSIQVSESELKDQFSRTKLETQVAYVLLKKEDFKKRVQLSEPDLRAYFEGRKDSYKIKEKRIIQYILVPTAEIIPSITVSDNEILQQWNQTPHDETVTIAHILVKADDPSKNAEVQATAKNILKMAKAGKPSFADLAKSYSRDANSANQGGVLQPFSRGTGAVPKEIEDAAFSLKPNELSEVIQTQEGYEIIKLLQHDKPSLEANRDSLINAVKLAKARERAKAKAEEAAGIAQKQKDLSQAGKNLGIATELKTSRPFSKEDNPYDFEVSPALQNEAFELKEKNSIGKPVEHPQGYAVAKLIDVQMARQGDFAESRQQVEKDFTESKAQELMQAEAIRISAEANKQSSLEKVAKAANLSVKTTQPFKADGTPDPEIGSNPAFNSAAFELKPGGVSGPIPLVDKVAVLQVKSRTPFDEAAFQKEKSQLQEQALAQKQGPYFEDYISKVTDELDKARKIRINAKAIEMLETRY